MAKFQESEVKKTIRQLITEACGNLQRQGLTYLGLPAENALDIKALDSLLRNVICIDESQLTLNETRRSIARLRINERKFIVANMWDYLRDNYQNEPLIADVTFLDFYGGGIREENPFAHEIAGLRNYFVKHEHYQNKAFVLAWTYMPRDRVTCSRRIIPIERRESNKIKLGDSQYEKEDIYGRTNRWYSARL